MRQKICKDCGKIFLCSSCDTCLCSDCHAAAQKAAQFRSLTCSTCGKEFVGAPSSKYCPVCAREAKRQASAKCKHSMTKRPIGSTDICTVCGKPYIVLSGNQRYCKDCSAAATKAAIAAHKKAYAAAHKEEIAARRKAARIDRKVCVICGKTFGGTPSVTCSPECAKEYKHQRQVYFDSKRRNQHSVFEQPNRAEYHSGIPGITWHKSSSRWMLKLNSKYIGTYATVEAAAAARDAVLAGQGSDK